MPHGYREGRITPGFAGFLLVAGHDRRLRTAAGASVRALVLRRSLDTRDEGHLRTSRCRRPKGRWNSRPLPSQPVAGEPLVELPGPPSEPPLARYPAVARGMARPALPPRHRRSRSRPRHRPRARSRNRPPSPRRSRTSTPSSARRRPPSLRSEPQPEATPAPDPQAAAATPSADAAPPCTTGRSREAGRGVPASRRVARRDRRASSGHSRSRRRGGWPMDAPRAAAGRAGQGRRRRRGREPLEDRPAGPRRDGRAPGPRGSPARRRVAGGDPRPGRPGAPGDHRPSTLQEGQRIRQLRSPGRRPPSRRVRPSSSTASCRAFAARPEATDIGRGWPRTTRSSPPRGGNPSSSDPRWGPPRTSAGDVGATITPIIGSTSPGTLPRLL